MRQAVMGPLGKVGTHDRPLEIRAQKYVSDVNSRGWTPWPTPPALPTAPYQPETPRLGQVKDGRCQDLPGPSLPFPKSWPEPLLCGEWPPPHITSSSLKANLVLSFITAFAQVSLSSSWLITVLLSLSLGASLLV